LSSAYNRSLRAPQVVEAGSITKVTSRPLLLPSIFLRKVDRIGIAEVLNALSGYEHDRIQFTYRSKDVPGDLAVMYFKTEASALDCLGKIKNLRINGKKLYSSYRFILTYSIGF
jgi:hypothetical protein